MDEKSSYKTGQYSNDQTLYSPSDLAIFLGCHHASFLDVKSLSEDMDKAEANTGEDKCEIILFPPDASRPWGFTPMPVPDDGDLFFDMEGDPIYPNGLEYLFRVYYFRGDEKIFNTFWAHNEQQEKKPLKNLWAF